MEEKTFAEKLLNLRKEKGFTQQQLSDIMKIPKRTLEDWECGRRTPPEYVQLLVLDRINSLKITE